uniref:Nuclear receptor 2C2-associated protein n=1 Tax=Lates calcarifer TaxID=8187 RepID=A0A4W6DAW4_LATCA
MASSVICRETQSRVSSVLNRDVKQYGKKYMFDCNEETCWNSDQGECQWVSLEFPQSVKLSELKVQFQGGFSAKTCRLEGCPKDGVFTVISHFYPEDNNSLQISFICTMQHLSGQIRVVIWEMLQQKSDYFIIFLILVEEQNLKSFFKLHLTLDHLTMICARNNLESKQSCF